MRLDCVLPSKWRKEKLDKCLNSIFHSVKNITDHDIHLYIYFSVQEEYQHYWNHFCAIGNIHLKFIEEYRVPDFWNSHLKSTGADAMLYLNDDVEVLPDTIRIIIREFEKRFPDGDGIMGINQKNLPRSQIVEAAFGVIGTKYAERFPNKQVFPLDYYRFFVDLEMCEYAKSINKFHFCEQAEIFHYHPAFGGTKDETHDDVRKYIKKDKETYDKRKALGYLWGRDFSTINKE